MAVQGYHEGRQDIIKDQIFFNVMLSSWPSRLREASGKRYFDELDRFHSIIIKAKTPQSGPERIAELVRLEKRIAAVKKDPQDREVQLALNKVTTAVSQVLNPSTSSSSHSKRDSSSSSTRSSSDFPSPLIKGDSSSSLSSSSSRSSFNSPSPLTLTPSSSHDQLPSTPELSSSSSSSSSDSPLPLPPYSSQGRLPSTPESSSFSSSSSSRSILDSPLPLTSIPFSRSRLPSTPESSSSSSSSSSRSILDSISPLTLTPSSSPNRLAPLLSPDVKGKPSSSSSSSLSSRSSLDSLSPIMPVSSIPTSGIKSVPSPSVKRLDARLSLSFLTPHPEEPSLSPMPSLSPECLEVNFNLFEQQLSDSRSSSIKFSNQLIGKRDNDKPLNLKNQHERKIHNFEQVLKERAQTENHEPASLTESGLSDSRTLPHVIRVIFDRCIIFEKNSFQRLTFSKFPRLERLEFNNCLFEFEVPFNLIDSMVASNQYDYLDGMTIDLKQCVGRYGPMPIPAKFQKKMKENHPSLKFNSVKRDEEACCVIS